MRESVPHSLRFRLQNLFHSLSVSTVPALAVCFALAGCTGKTQGQVILALQTDMSMPEDVTKVKIEVKADGVSRYDRVFIIDPNEPDNEKIPATLSVVAGEKENETIELKVVGLRGGSSGADEPRTLNKTVTTIPTERIAMLRIPMQWLCTNTVDENGNGDFIDDFGDGEYESACAKKNGKETACVAGGCEDVHVDSSKLPEFAADAVFGGADDPGTGGKCFPTEECFDAGTDVTPDADCVVTFDPPSDDIVNFAVLATTGGIGECRAAGSSSPCYIGLDKSRDFGWYELEDGEEPGGGPEPPQAPSGRRFQLPQGVCDRIDDGRAIGVRVSTDDACEVTKTPKFPTCGPWSSVGPKEEPPPPGDDADGDGVSAELGDCDDDDNSVYPGALEACDEKDNDCNMAVDDNCVADLPFSHRVDFSALDSFTSSPDYAIYQAFDGSKPLDLDHRTLTFTPGEDFTHYLVSAGDLEWDEDLGELVPVTTGEDVSNCDDCYTSVPLEFPFDFFGTEYTTAFPSSNGYLTFGVGDETYSESIQQFLANAPRISAFWDDLDTTGTPGIIDDEVHYFSDASKLVVTYQNIQIFSSSETSNTFQFVLFADGTIKISYNGMDDLSESSLVGITPGSLNGGVDCGDPMYTSCFGLCTNLDSDPGHCGACGNVCPGGLCLSGACAPDVQCSVSGYECSGLCVGSCQLDTAGTCDGMCYGTCDGTCDTEDTPGHCSGNCDGDCTGTCQVTGSVCSGLCYGACYVDNVSECGDPTADLAGSCIFQPPTIYDATSCTQSATVAGTGSAVLSCGAETCNCCKFAGTTEVCFETGSTAATACQSAETLVGTLLKDCLAADQCGAGCPATVPSARATCNSDDIASCYYTDMTTSTYCDCTNNAFVCN